MWQQGANIKLPPFFNPNPQQGADQKRKHVVNELYDRGLDFNVHDLPPAGSFMLATIPRSGSTYCAIRLWQTGLVGAPMEYLNFPIMRSLFNRLGYKADEKGYISPTLIEKYWLDVQKIRTSPNGVFGYKMFTANFSEIAKVYPDFLQKITPNFAIYLTREDILGQSISYSRAQRSKVWFAGIPNTPIPDYDFQHIKQCLLSICYQKSFWESVFQMTDVTPLRITYEELLARDSEVMERVLVHMGITPDTGAAIHVPGIVRQADHVSEEWRQRFLEDASEEDLARLQS